MRHLASLALLALAGCGAAAVQPDAPAPDGIRSVRVTRIADRHAGTVLEATGTLVPRETFAASADTPGAIVRRVLVEEGDFVRQGQVLAELDSTLPAGQIAQQTAIVAQHRTMLRQAQAEARRAQPLAGEGVLSTEAVQARGYRAETAAAALRVQEAQLTELRARIARMQVRAPVGGRVIERTVRTGDVTGAPTPMFTIVPGGTTELRVAVPEGRLAELRLGMPAAVTLADGTRLDGQVAALGTRIDQTSAQGNVRLRLRPPPGQPWPLLRPGASGSARFTGGGGSAPSVPEAAVQYDSGGSSVMVLGPGNRVAAVRVRTGARANGHVTLVDGPPVGTPVLLGSAAFVAAGDTVRPVHDTAR